MREHEPCLDYSVYFPNNKQSTTLLLHMPNELQNKAEGIGIKPMVLQSTFVRIITCDKGQVDRKQGMVSSVGRAYDC